jgi:two-component system, NtrC family, sensor kinase
MNLMCDELARARETVAAETAGRIAALEQLRHADRLATVGKLSSGIAHELGTPLNVVSGRAKMIASGETAGPETAENARIIVSQAERMTKIIRQLLDFARRRQPQKEPTDLHAIVRQTLSLMRTIADKHKVSLETAGDAVPALAEVDGGQIQQALANLVLNGIQAMPHGGRLTVGLGLERTRPPADHGGPEADYLRLWVRDEGEGIEPEVLERVFEPFFTTKQVGEGTGLGLSVCYGIVREHGGWLAAESRPGEGSRFSIHLPPSPAPDRPESGSHDPNRRTAPRTP